MDVITYGHNPSIPLTGKVSTYLEVEACLESFGWEMDEPTEWDRIAQLMYPASSFLHRFGRQDHYPNSLVRTWLGF